MVPDVVIVLGNFDQLGPFWAVKHFLVRNPGWREAGGAMGVQNDGNPFASIQPSIPDTSFFVLAASELRQVTQSPSSFDHPVAFTEVTLDGFYLAPTLDFPPGMLHSLVYFRSFQ